MHSFLAATGTGGGPQVLVAFSPEASRAAKDGILRIGWARLLVSWEGWLPRNLLVWLMLLLQAKTIRGAALHCRGGLLRTRNLFGRDAGALQDRLWVGGGT